MDLQKISVKLRPRSVWEASDLGIIMVRDNWLKVSLSTFLVMLPVIIVAHIFFYDHLWAAALIVWWFKPVYDRVILMQLSRSMFGSDTSIRSAFNFRTYFEVRTWLFLTVFRFLPNRSFALPTWELEQLTGDKRRQRMQVLKKGRHYGGTALTISYMILELVLYFGLIAMLVMLDPNSSYLGSAESLTDYFNLAYFERSWIDYASQVIYFVVVIFLEPMYVAAGFAMYINRRTIQEAWDIELSFKQLVQSKDKV